MTSKTSEISKPMKRSAFRFEFRPVYEDLVEKQLYSIQRYDLRIPDHVLQMKSSSNWVCLFCTKSIPSSGATREFLKAHFATHYAPETRMITEDAFDFYHKTFFALPKELQMSQIYFNPCDTENVHCLLCSRTIKGSYVQGHIFGAKHLEKVPVNKDNYWTITISLDMLGKAAKEQTEKRRCKDLAGNEAKLEQVDVKHQHPDNTAELLLHKSGNLLNCLLCMKTVDNVHHLQDLKHTKKLTTNNGAFLKFVKDYHLAWQGKLREVISYKKYFITCNSRNFNCLLCNQNVGISQVVAHCTMFPCSFVSVHDALFDDSVDWVAMKARFVSTTAPKGEYPENIVKKFYGARIIEQARISDALNVYTLQRRPNPNNVSGSSVIFCLACRATICDENLDENIVKEHLKSRQHMNFTHWVEKIKGLYKYHAFFLPATRPNQLQQHLVNPYKQLFKCALCKLKFLRKEVMKHVTSCLHNGPLENPRENQLTEKPEHEVFEVERQEEFYDDEIILDLYGSCNTPKGHRRPPILVMQKRKQYEKFCLACGVSIYASAMEHINGQKHTLAVSQNFQAILAYHRYWMSQPPERQYKQVYFNPWNNRQMHCTVCRRRFFIDPAANEIAAHEECIKAAQWQECQRAFPEEYQKFAVQGPNNGEYTAETMKRLFYGFHYDVSRDLLDSDIPLAYANRAHFVCLLCNTPREARIGRDAYVWKRHLLRLHCENSSDRLDALRFLVGFHEYWMQQTPQRQLYLANYTIQSRTSLLCARRHLVPLNKAVEHIENECELQSEPRQQQQVLPVDKNTVDVVTRTLKKIILDDRNQGAKNDDNENAVKEHIIELVWPGNEENANNLALPIYFKNHEQFFQSDANSQTVVCTACQIFLQNDLLVVRHHIGHAMHLLKTHINNKLRYHCEICPRFFKAEMEWLNHLDSPMHHKSVKQLGETRRNDVTEHLCRTCNMVIFGDKITLFKHKQVRSARNARMKPGDLTADLKQLLSTRRKIEEKTKSLVTNCQQYSKTSEDSITACISDLENLLKPTYPDVKIYKFGSRVVGFTNEDSDLDLFVDLDNWYKGNLDYREEHKLVVEVRKLLRNHPKIFTDLHSILSARVPIIKAFHRASEIDCDLSFTSGLSVENTRLIKFYADFDPLFYDSMLFLKEWGAQMAPKLKNDMTSYALCMLLIFHMQVDGQLPSVYKLREFSTLEDIVPINGWETVNYDDLDADGLHKECKKAQSVADVVVGFFNYYGNVFEFNENVACPLLGRTFSVKLFANKGEGLPAEMHTYKRKVATDPDAQFRATCFMFVQDPFDLGHNLTKNVSRQFANNFKKVCRLSHEHVCPRKSTK